MTEPKEITTEEMESIFSPHYPKYQASFFAGNGKEKQLVIRSNDKKEFEGMLVWANVLLKAAQEEAGEKKKTDDLALMCPHHKVKLVFREGVSKKTGKPYAFWSCPEKNADGSWCNYAPPQDSINKEK